MSRLFADLSNNNPHLDAAKYKAAGHRLVGLKATQGLGFVDKDHERLAKAAHDHHIAVAHYHFAEPAHGAASQARLFWETVKPTYKRGDYVVLDLEWYHPRGAKAARQWARTFQRELIRISGHRAILYTGRSYLADYLGYRIRLGRGRFTRFWVAEYAAHLLTTAIPWARPVWAWQRTGDGVGRAPHTLPGCPQDCDVNVLNVRSYRRLARYTK